MTILIVEGCDFTGKSTLINKLSKHFNLQVFKNKLPKNRTDLYNWTSSVIHLSRAGDLICDRSPWISEPIYGYVLRGDSLVNVIESHVELDRIGAIVIWCCPPLTQVMKCNNDQMAGVKENLPNLYGYYKGIIPSFNVPVIEYDFTKESDQSLFRRVEKLMLMSNEDKEVLDVEDFHNKFGVPMPETVQAMDEETKKFREKFLQEELDEFWEAYNKGDLVTAFDSLLDLTYVVKGTALFMGITPQQWARGWDAVQRANMSKRRATSATESKRGTALDVVKPEGWQPPEPELKKILFGDK